MKLQIWLGEYDDNDNMSQETSKEFHDCKQLLENTQNRGLDKEKQELKTISVNNDLLLLQQKEKIRTLKQEPNIDSTCKLGASDSVPAILNVKPSNRGLGLRQLVTVSSIICV